MNAGLPGTGLGGIFYILGALWMPVHASYQRLRGRQTAPWPVILRQTGIALGVVGMLWLTGWAVGYLIALRPPRGGAGLAMTSPQAVHSVIRWAGVMGSAGVLALLMTGVQILRVTVSRPSRRVSERRTLVSRGSRVAAGVVFLLGLLPLELNGQHAAAASGPLARADALFVAGESEQARLAYEEALAEDPESSRAMFQLARLLEDEPERALELLRAYVTAEPDDAWGFWALAETLGRAGDWGAASEALSRARRLEPGERDFMIAHADALRRVGRPRAAAAALESALARERDPSLEKKLDALRAELAPSVETNAGASRDSDGNVMLSARLDADAAIGEGLRLGVTGSQLRSRDAAGWADSWQGSVGLTWRGAPGTALEAQAGVAGLPVIPASNPPGQSPGTSSGRGAGASAGSRAGSSVTPVLRLRARWHPASGPAAELRFRREPVSSSPLLLTAPLVVSEGRAAVDLPLLGPLYARGLARTGRLSAGTADTDTNTRTGYGGGLMLRGGAGEIGALAQRTRYAHDTQAGYFAPERIDAVELAGYLEIYPAWPLVIALDGGLGGERVTPWGATPGSWEPSFRLWSQLAWNLAPGRTLALELDAYDSRSSVTVSPTASAWQWGSVGLSIRTAIR